MKGYALPRLLFNLIASAALLLTSPAFAFILDQPENDSPTCVVSVIKANGQTATVCYRGPRGEIAQARNCIKMDITKVPQAAHMLGCELNS
jgi:hypothetical protein